MTSRSQALRSAAGTRSRLTPSGQVRKFICVGTLEEKIDEMIEDKKALANLVISDGEGWLTELSTDTLREVFALGEGAVSE